MKVKNLMKRLEKMNPEATVKLNDKNGEELLFVLSLQNDDHTVWLESESDVDMANEIQTRFDDAIENGIDELDVYMEMLETGISAEMVRKYLGDEAANHMEQFCKEHALNDLDSVDNGWVRTDDLQWRKQINETSYHLVEVRETPSEYIVVSGIIDIEDYSEDDIRSCINSYGYDNMDAMKELYEEECFAVIAECLFEQTSEIELTGFGGFNDEDRAEKFALDYIDVQEKALIQAEI